MKPESELTVKTCGGDYEITAFFEGDATGTGNAPLAARLLLAQIEGTPALHPSLRVIREVKEGEGPPPGGYYHTLDWGRIFLPTNGSSIYIDCDHLELAMPEVRGARQHCAAMRAMFLIVRDAMDRANASLPPGQRLRVLLNNVDAHGNCFGTHLNFSFSATAFHNTVRHQHGRHLQFLASWNATSMLFGQGRVGPENGTGSYQLSQRADFIDHLLSENTQFPPGRPLVNTRNEPHTGINSGIARLHDIVHDNNLCQTGAVLKVGLMQIVLCMIELEELPPHLLLDDPVEAAHRFSHDVDFEDKVDCSDGRKVNAVDMFEGFVETAHEFARDGKLDGIVDEVPLILELAAEVASDLRQRRRDALARKLDAFAKHKLLTDAMQTHGFTWESSEVKMLDHLYSSLDDGLYWSLERLEKVDRPVKDDEILYLRDHAPANTRASLRARLLQLIPADAIQRVDWSRVSLEAPDSTGRPRSFVIHLPDPAACLMPDTVVGRATSFAELMEGLFPGQAAPTRPTEAPAQDHAAA